MRSRLIIASLAAAGLLGTSAYAQTTAGGGVSASTPDGSIAGGATAGTNDKAARKHDGKRHKREDRRDSATSNSASTYGSGTIYTDKNRATGGVTAGGSASGTGSQSTSTSIDAYGSTDRNGSTGEVYGDSTADSTNPR
ncbi:hypothetical protein A0J57_11000 [Sphingobium sp. 22B]|jgi:hypothetical protein|uniref:hypothetical protein n=1 Tax=unclassified Sphingobium TaxID=2611147 RepID=UPI000783A5AA|nr:MULTISPECIES: hypothetical protein [unclassified Sphingobium]KXU32294.1 hypothetical protein AXW74_07595 [Sphingobium sp. AM]KYC32186.1 hypothetical protein A0J57_11000 [Sphingobium sp. 22B]OAP31818.1 hypothetical protein A8O16_10800 [Sphingobium sp. 20006FA]